MNAHQRRKARRETERDAAWFLSAFDRFNVYQRANLMFVEALQADAAERAGVRVDEIMAHRNAAHDPARSLASSLRAPVEPGIDRFTREQIAAAFDVPSHMLGDL